MGITKFVLKRPVTTILAVICVIVFGISSVTGMTMELSPEMDMPMMMVMTRYTGASPEDMDELITTPIEDAVSSMTGLSQVSSTSSEGSSTVMLEYEYGTDMDEAYDDLKKKIDQISMRLPDDVDTPTIMEMSSNQSESIMLSINNPSQDDLYDYVSDEIVPEFEKLANVADVSTMGGSQSYIRVELKQEKMKQYGVTMSSIASDITAANSQIPGGTTELGSQEYSVSTRMKYDTEELLSEIPLTTSSGEGTVYLSDAADVYTYTSDDSGVARYNGEDTVSIGITKEQSANAISLSDSVKKVIESLERNDPDLQIIVANDSADQIKSSLLSIAQTVGLAVIISMVIIFLFFGDLKASLIVGSSIPISILVALICMGVMGLSLNIITMSALALGVGMMVDNSIVVLESCFRVTADERFGDYMKEALRGSDIVGSSVIASTVTTCVVFLPLAFLNGMTGQMLAPLGYTIVFCMTASLFSAITVVPLCYMLYKPEERLKAPLSKPVAALQEDYRSIMRVLLPKKKTVMLTTVGLTVFSLFLATKLNTELMASDDNGQVSVSIDTRPGLNDSEVEKILLEVEKIVSADSDVDSYMTRSSGGGPMGGSSASVTAYLKDDRQLSTEEVANKWKTEMADIDNCDIDVSVSGSMSMMTEFGNSYQTIIKGTDYDAVKTVTTNIVNELSERPEVTKVHSNIENSTPIVEITVDAIKAKAAGLTAAGIGNTINQLTSGMTATSINVDGEDTSVKIEYPDGTYDTLDQLRGVLLSTPSGSQVLLSDVADIGFADSPSSIRKEDKQYMVTISAQYTENADQSTKMLIDSEVVNPNLTSSVTTGMNSRDRSMNTEFKSIFKAILISIFLIFVVMASQFESPKFSLMVMFTIPFSLIGSFGLLWLCNSAISMTSLIGFLMLVGTVVNAGILYVDTVNQYRETMDKEDALIEAGATRMRPILMTTLTTIISMIPMALAFGSSGKMTQGLALVNIGGLTASTILSLLMLPVFYSIIDGIKIVGRKSDGETFEEKMKEENAEDPDGDDI